jgi:hypothetical protein
MRHAILRHFAALALLIGVGAACHDAPTAARNVGGPSLPALKKSSNGVTAATPSPAGGYDFTVDPSETQTFLFGDHGIYFPAHSICDPATSAYGPNEWDQPCAPLATAITIHVDVSEVDGHPRVDFAPALRFVPKPLSDDRHWVILYLRDDSAAESPKHGRHRHSAREFNILWAAPDGTLVDESIYDSTMRTRVHSLSGTVSRRIKHFSGYLVTARSAEASEAQ